MQRSSRTPASWTSGSRGGRRSVNLHSGARCLYLASDLLLFWTESGLGRGTHTRSSLVLKTHCRATAVPHGDAPETQGALAGERTRACSLRPHPAPPTRTDLAHGTPQRRLQSGLTVSSRLLLRACRHLAFIRRHRFKVICIAQSRLSTRRVANVTPKSHEAGLSFPQAAPSIHALLPPCMFISLRSLTDAPLPPSLHSRSSDCPLHSFIFPKRRLSRAPHLTA